LANPELQLAADHLAVAVSQMREDLYASVYKDVPAGRFTRMIHDTSRLAVAQHLLLALRDLVNSPGVPALAGQAWSVPDAVLITDEVPHAS
jgi:hypothetical protein